MYLKISGNAPQNQNSAHPNFETVDPLFAIIHIDMEINVRLPFSPSITQKDTKSYVLGPAFFHLKKKH
jgi:hypothetical protein